MRGFEPIGIYGKGVLTFYENPDENSNIQRYGVDYSFRFWKLVPNDKLNSGLVILHLV